MRKGSRKGRAQHHEPSSPGTAWGRGLLSSDRALCTDFLPNAVSGYECRLAYLMLNELSIIMVVVLLHITAQTYVC